MHAPTMVNFLAASARSVYFVSQEKWGNGFVIYQWLDDKWEPMPGKTARNIAVGYMGKLLITDDSGRIFYQKAANKNFDVTTNDANDEDYDD